jgi:CheY-like chemotaxis protein
MNERKPLVLIVDDHEPNRMKLSMAVRNLGHETEQAVDGKSALDRMRAGGIDLVLLDIVMPELDGFGVLEAIQADSALKEIPVLVISSLEETEEVVRAIQLGAADFLTKPFDPVLLRARVNTCLEKKRLRDRELDYLADVERLSVAARILEKKDFDPTKLGLESVARRPEPLGDLARVFLGMADQIYRREMFYRRQIRLLQGSIMLILLGACFGVAPALSRFLMLDGLNPIGLTAWVIVFSACISLVGCLATGVWPRFNRKNLPYLITLSIFGTVLPEVALFWVAEHVPAMVLSIVVTLEAMIVFIIAAMLGLETPNIRRFFGLCLGLGCVLFLILPTANVDGQAHILWILAALIVPLCYASEDLLIAAPRPDAPPLAVVFAISAIGVVFAVPVALMSDNFIPAGQLDQVAFSALASISAASVLGTCLLIQTVRTNGAVFASQGAYTIALAGIIWSILLLDERLSVWVVAAVACVLSGIVLVRPNHEVEEFETLDLPEAQRRIQEH